MKITAVRHYTLHPGWRKNLIFVKVETDAGLHGWGEAYSQYDRDRAVVAQLEGLARYAVGRSPFDIKHFTQMAFDDYAARRGSLELFCAVSGIEHALWDIVGRSCGQPVYNLLGGRCRERIRVYANGWSYGMEKPSDYARAAESVVAQGWTALKLDPLPAPWRNYIPREHEEHAVQVVKAVRDAVGPHVVIFADANCGFSLSAARRFVRELGRDGAGIFLEQPCATLADCGRLRASWDGPMVMDETIVSLGALPPHACRFPHLAGAGRWRKTRLCHHEGRDGLEQGAGQSQHQHPVHRGRSPAGPGIDRTPLGGRVGCESGFAAQILRAD